MSPVIEEPERPWAIIIKFLLAEGDFRCVGCSTIECCKDAWFAR